MFPGVPHMKKVEDHCSKARMTLPHYILTFQSLLCQQKRIITLILGKWKISSGRNAFLRSQISTVHDLYAYVFLKITQRKYNNHH